MYDSSYVLKNSFVRKISYCPVGCRMCKWFWEENYDEMKNRKGVWFRFFCLLNSKSIMEEISNCPIK